MKTKFLLLLFVIILVAVTSVTAVGFRSKQTNDTDTDTDSVAPESSSAPSQSSDSVPSTSSANQDVNSPTENTESQAQNAEDSDPQENSVSPDDAAAADSDPEVAASPNSTNSTNGTNTTNATTPTPLTNLQIVGKLLNAPSNIDRVNIIKDNSTFVFDFYAMNASVSGVDGFESSANRYNFPVIFQSLVSTSVGFLGPCGLYSPKINVRAAQLALVIQGTIYTGFLAEDGAPLILNILTPGQMTYFTRASLHWLANLECFPAMYISTYNDEVPGIMGIAQNYFDLPADVVSPNLGYLDPIDVEIIASNIPENITLGIAECVARCELL